MEQVVRQGVGKLHRLSRCGVVEADVPGVEELAREDKFSMTFADDAVGSIATIGQVVDAIASAQ